MNKGIKQITDILRTPNHKQIIGRMILFKKHNDINSEIVGKCAMGEIGCQLGVAPKDLYNIERHLDLYEKIMKKTKIPNWLIHKNLPYLDIYKNHWSNPPSKDNLTVNFDFDACVDNIISYIVEMNDNGFTYKQIANFLETTFGEC